MQKTSKKPLRFATLIPFLILLLAGGAGGYLIGQSLAGIFEQVAQLPDALVFALVFLIVISALYLQILLHEAGHLVFGLLTGYRFLSFRVGSLMLVREQGKFRLKSFSIAGTGGQCILIPPAWNEHHNPFVLYHLGGAIMNFITGAIFLLLYLFVSLHAIIAALFASLAVSGVAIGLMNAVPLNTELLSNDGGNVILLRKDPLALRASFRMLEIHSTLAKSTRLKDMPEDWFTLPVDAGLGNQMTNSIEVFAINRLLDQQEIGKALERIRKLFDSGASIHGLHRNMLRIDLIYCMLMQGDAQSAESELDDTLRKFMQAMKNFPSILRTQYATALLKDNDAKQAEEILKRFDRIAKKYPYPCDIESERELILAAKQKSLQNQTDTTSLLHN
ncbi:MAG: hypothetical protein CVV04_02615 [Firmicutes bacterium HGW-Firmicutes-9]|jgi:hypothetical protein|nr:MAG: hypothetical protein CVV04_02615 [Firmicutes bacterium HGW-Firmicutes-9]